MRRIYVSRKPGGEIHQGILTYNGKSVPCCLGRSGITTKKREGDGATPSGAFKLLYGFYRKDRTSPLQSQLEFNQINDDSGWCDEPHNPNYNQYITLPFPDSHEEMNRKDRLYDVCIVMDYNIFPRKRYAGSAIFFHQTSIDQKPTEGCVAIDPEHMQILLPMLTPETVMIIRP